MVQFPFELYDKLNQMRMAKAQEPLQQIQQVGQIGAVLQQRKQQQQEFELKKQQVKSESINKLITAKYEPLINTGKVDDKGEPILDIMPAFDLANMLQTGDVPKDKNVIFKKGDELIISGTDPKTGLPVYSRAPSAGRVTKLTSASDGMVDLVSVDPRTKEKTNLGKVTKGTKVVTEQQTPEERELSKAEAGIIPSAEAGRASLAEQSLKNIEDVKKLLFPDGTATSFRSDLALKSKLPIFGTPMPKDKEAQNLFRKMSDSLGGKVLIQTGVAARPEEVKSEYKKFYTNFFSDPEATMEGLNQLQDFYRTYLSMLKGKQLTNNTSNTTVNTSTGSATAPIIQRNKKTGEERISYDGGKTWQTK